MVSNSLPFPPAHFTKGFALIFVFLYFYFYVAVYVMILFLARLSVVSRSSVGGDR